MHNSENGSDFQPQLDTIPLLPGVNPLDNSILTGVGSFRDPLLEVLPQPATSFVPEQYQPGDIFHLTSWGDEPLTSKTNADSLIGNVLSLVGEYTTESLEQFSTHPDFLAKMRLAFGDDWEEESAQSLITDITNHQELPPLTIVPAPVLETEGAFGAGTIYLSDSFINQNLTNPQAIGDVLLEELGHYLDSQLNLVDSPGDEGRIFAALVQNQPLDESQLAILKAEDDSGVLKLDSETIPVEYSLEETGIFTVNNTGQFTVDFLFDAGSYKSEFAVFSLTGMEGLTPGSPEFIQEAARRVLSNSTLGYIILDDQNEGAKFNGELGEGNKNEGSYLNVKTFTMTPGDRFAFLLMPNGTMQEVFDNPGIDGNKRPLFSIAEANPGNATQIMQLAAGTFDGGVFGMEDLRRDQSSDADYNDIIFHVRGAAGKATPWEEVVDSGKRWDSTTVGQELLTYAQTNNAFEEETQATQLSASLANDTGTSQTDDITADPQIQGNISGEVTSFKAGFNGNLVDVSATLQADGTFSLTKEALTQVNNGSLGDGGYTLTLQAEDSQGQVLDTTTVVFTLDTTAPQAPTTLGLSSGGNVTNNNTPTITGEAETDSKVELFSGSQLLGEGIANSQWAIATATLADGVQSVTARATDVAGNVSTDSEALEFTIDTTAPQLNITSPVADAVLTDGARLTGKLDETGSGIASLTYQFSDGIQVTVPINENGEFDVELDLTGLSNGSQTLIITTTDLAGNTNSNEISININLDITAPVITVDLTTDTESTNSDQITSNPEINGSVTDSDEIISFKAGFDDTATENFVDVLGQLQPDGSFSFDAEKLKEINGDVDLSEGEHILKLIASDTEGNVSEVFNFSFTLDLTPPTAIISSNLVDNPSSVDVTYNEAVSNEAFETGNYTLTISGGDNDGQTVEVSSVEKVSDTIARLILAAPLTQTSYQLALGTEIKDLAGNTIAENTILDFSVIPPSVEISPSNGEELVTLTRETIVRFNSKVDPSTINDQSFYLIANGERLKGRIVVSSTEEFATFFYDEPLPQSTEVRVVVDGDLIKSRSGIAIDGNRDGIAGGIATADFRTLPLTRIEGTDVWGYVYDSYNKNEDGSNIPLEGVVIRLDSLPDVFAVTDENGYFKLEDVPAPDFYVYIDASNVTNVPEGTQYASLGKAFHSVPGQEIQLEMDGEPFNIYLPTMAESDIVELSSTEETAVGFGTESLAFLQQEFPDIDPELWQETQVMFAPGSAQDDGGTAATRAMIVPVNPERLPAPLPPNMEPGLVISIQAGSEDGFNRESQGGATNFDVPAPVAFPNLEGLAPGEKSFIWSFDHDAGDWVVIGTGTVSDDGKSIVSDEGVGVLAPGWHFVQSGAKNEIIVNISPEPPQDQENEASNVNQPNTYEVGLIVDGEFQPLTVGAEAQLNFSIPDFDPQNFNFREVLNIPENPLDFNFSPSLTFTLPSWFPDLPTGEQALFNATGKLRLDGTAAIGATLSATTGSSQAILSSNVEASVNASASVDVDDGSLICDIPFGVGEFLCKPKETSVRLAGKPKFNFPNAEFTISRAATADFSVEANANASLFAETSTTISTKAFLRKISDNSPDIVVDDETAENASFSTESGFGDDPRAYYRFVLSNGFEITGQTSREGQINEILPPNIEYNLFIYSPSTNRSIYITGKTDSNGSCEKNDLPLDNFGGFDKDRDGIPDIGEITIGTDPNNPDSDGDGILDNIELEEGLNPLGEQPPITGVIATLPLRGEAREVEVVSQLINVSPVTIGRAILPDNIVTQRRAQIAYVATGSYGLAAVDVSDFDNPIILGQLDLPGGNATDVAVDTNLQIAAVATGTGAVKLVDVSDPMLPKVEQTINIPANQVEVSQGRAYVASGDEILLIDLLTGEILNQESYAGGSIDDMAIAEGFLYTISRSGTSPQTINKIEINNTLEPAVDSLTITNRPTFGRLHIAAGGGYIYVGAIDESFSNQVPGVSIIQDTGSELTLVGSPSDITAFDVAPNGSNLLLFSGANTSGPRNPDLGILDISNPAQTDRFITSIPTPGEVNDIAIASGIAYVADGSGGLAVVNYLPFDDQGQAPTNVSINSLVTDTDPETPGIQVVEGSTLPFTTAVEDDVQVRNVELLFNGEVVQNDVSFPFDLSGIAPNITPDNNQLEVQIRATDTGGNSTLSEILTFDLLPDTSPPQVANSNPENNGVGENVKAISIRFNENIDTSRINLSGITLTSLGTDGTIGGGDDSAVALAAVETPSNRRLVVLLEQSLPIGKYQLTLDPSIIADNAGNNLESPLTLEFTATKTLAFSRTDFSVGEKPRSMTSADFDGDGDIDLAVAHPGRINANSFNGNTVSILFNDGEGNFSEPVDLTTEVGPQVQSGDFNGDGNIDLAVNSLENDNLAIYLNNGNGEFTQSGIFDTGERPETIPPADLDGDGDLDLVVLNTVRLPSNANKTGDSFSVFFNDGNGNFATPVNYTLNSGLNSISTGDLDSDGDLDLAIVNRRTEDIFLLYNDGEGNFNTSEAEILNNVAREPIRASLGDLNGDNNLDIIVNRFVSSGSGVYTYLSNGDGTFAQRVFYNTPSYPGGRINPIDFDLDGDLDIAISHAVVFLGSERTEGNKFTVLRNNGDGTFKEPLTIEVGNFPGSPVVADLDGDGDVDTVTSNGDDGTISVLKNEII